MPIKAPNTAKQYRLLFRANMALGVLISLTSVFFIITGDYADLHTRKIIEGWLNVAFIGGILYTVAFWYMCAFTRPLFEKFFSRRSDS